MILHGDCLNEMRAMEDNSVDSIVTDPPYGISFMNKKWDYDVPKVEVWQEAMRALKPGGHILVACGTRTQHRMCVNIEDAGFEIRDIVAWIYGSGFPKSLNIGKAVDKLQGNEREFIENKKSPYTSKDTWKNSSMHRTTDKDGYRYTEITQGTSKHEGWGTALKPAMELWTLARKPLSEKTVAENVLKHGTGGINIDECRVGTDENLNYGTGKKSNVGFKTSPQNNDRPVYDGKGRFPANLIHDNSEEVRECFPETKTNAGKGSYGDFEGKNCYGDGWTRKVNQAADSGNASRFFKSIPQGRFPANLIHDGSDEVVGLFPSPHGAGHKRGGGLSKDGESMFCGNHDGNGMRFGDSGSASRFFYCAKASKSERNAGLEGFEEKQTWASQDKRESNSFDVFESDGRPKTVNKNNHPTVKPIKLMQYLVRLITPKGGTVLDPYMGSGSTGIACKKEGFEFIGIELDADYFEIAKARIEKLEHQHELF